MANAETGKARMFVANCRMSWLEFSFIPPERRSPVTVKIPPKSQVEIPHSGMLKEDIQRIADQNEVYGWVHASKVKNMKTYIGACYDFKHIDMDRVGEAFEINQHVLTEKADTRLKQNMMAANEDLKRRTEGHVSINALEVVEVKPNGEKHGMVQRLRPAGADAR